VDDVCNNRPVGKANMPEPVMKGRSSGVKMGDRERWRFTGFENLQFVITQQEVNR
jgi:hypothetical protein